MTPEDINFAQECARGAHTMMAALKRWLSYKGMTPQDEAFVSQLDITAQAAKTWVRHKALELAPKESQEQQPIQPQ